MVDAWRPYWAFSASVVGGGGQEGLVMTSVLGSIRSRLADGLALRTTLVLLAALSIVDTGAFVCRRGA